MTTQTPLRVLSTDWCPYRRILKSFLDQHEIPYEQFNVDEDDDALAEINKLQNGGRTVPTVVYADGTHDVNPTQRRTSNGKAGRLGLNVRRQQRRRGRACSAQRQWR